VLASIFFVISSCIDFTRFRAFSMSWSPIFVEWRCHYVIRSSTRFDHFSQYFCGVCKPVNPTSDTSYTGMAVLVGLHRLSHSIFHSLFISDFTVGITLLSSSSFLFGGQLTTNN
jgi:hypothetical protein